MLMKDVKEIFYSFREMCNETVTLPQPIFNDANIGIYHDENIDSRCFALCLAELSGAVKKNGDLDMDQMITIIDKIEVTEKQRSDFITGTNACRNVCKFSFFMNLF